MPILYTERLGRRALSARALLPLVDGSYLWIDADNLPELSRHKWRRCPRNLTPFAYVMLPVYDRPWVGTPTFLGTTQRMVRLGHVVTQAEPGDVVVTKNGDRSDYRRANLTVMSRSEYRVWENRFRPPRTGRYKGVSKRNDRGGTKVWVARLQVAKQLVHQSFHATPEDAARAYDRAAREYWGVDCYLNFSVAGFRGAARRVLGGGLDCLDEYPQQ